MNKPAATESPPTIPLAPPTPIPVKPKETQPPPKAAPAKQLTLTKPEGGKWKLVITGPVKRSDINHLRRFLQLEYIRAKRKERAVASTLKRKEQTNATGS